MKRLSMKVRSRYVSISIAFILFLSGCGASAPQRTSHSSSMDMLGDSSIREASDTSDTSESPSGSWVIEGRLHIRVDRPEQHVEELKGRLKDSGYLAQISRGHTLGRGSIRLTVKVQPKDLSELLIWLRSLGDVELEELSRQEVSQQLLTAEIGLKSAQTTLKRLQRFLEEDKLTVDEVIKIEGELERLRTSIERTERERDHLQRKVDHATLSLIFFERVELAPELPEAKLLLSARPIWALAKGGSGEFGVGGSIFSPSSPASFHIDLDYLPDSSRSLLMIGSGLYSEFLGDGQRRYLNPHIGIKLGINYDQRASFAMGASAGLEIIRGQYGMVNLRGDALYIFEKDKGTWVTVGGLDIGFVF